MFRRVFFPYITSTSIHTQLFIKNCLSLSLSSYDDQLLNSATNFEPDGASKVIEAMSVMRIVFGESVRFKLLTSLLMSSNLNGIETHALTLINSILSRSTSIAEKIRLQCELQESGFQIQTLERVNLLNS